MSTLPDGAWRSVATTSRRLGLDSGLRHMRE